MRQTANVQRNFLGNRESIRVEWYSRPNTRKGNPMRGFTPQLGTKVVFPDGHIVQIADEIEENEAVDRAISVWEKHICSKPESLAKAILDSKSSEGVRRMVYLLLGFINENPTKAAAYRPAFEAALSRKTCLR